MAGDDDFDTGVTGGQYFYTIDLRDGWQIQCSLNFSYNHEAAKGDENWTFRVDGGVGKTRLFGNTPWKFSVQYWHSVKQSDAMGPDYQVRFPFGPEVSLPW